jgi:hypothetical protein
MKKYLISVTALVTAFILVSYSGIEREKIYRTVYCFVFVGSHGQEDDETKWELIDCSGYPNIICDGNVVGCKLKTTCIQTISGVARPCQVLTDADGTPIGGMGVIEIVNKDE